MVTHRQESHGYVSSEAVNSVCPPSRAVNSVLWIIKTSLESDVRFLWLLA